MSYKCIIKNERRYYKYSYSNFTQPTLTSNGILGGDSFATVSSTIYSSDYPAYKAFDGRISTSGTSSGWWAYSTMPVWIEFYNPIPLNITKLKITNYNGYNADIANYWASKKGEVYGSNDGVSWVLLTSYTNSVLSYNSSWDINLTHQGYYKYHKITSTEISAAYYGEGVHFQEIQITATQRIQNNATSSDYDVYEDVELYTPLHNNNSYYFVVV